MLLRRRKAPIYLNGRESPPLRSLQINNRRKRPQIELENVDRNDVDQALAVIAPASDCIDEGLAWIPTELPHFKAEYILK